MLLGRAGQDVPAESLRRHGAARTPVSDVCRCASGTRAPQGARASWPDRPDRRRCDARASRSGSRPRSYGCHDAGSSPARMNRLTPGRARNAVRLGPRNGQTVRNVIDADDARAGSPIGSHGGGRTCLRRMSGSARWARSTSRRSVVAASRRCSPSSSRSSSMGFLRCVRAVSRAGEHARRRGAARVGRSRPAPAHGSALRDRRPPRRW